MREILFRGKDTEENKWFYGSYYVTNDTTYCIKEDYDRHPENTKHYILFDEMTDWGLPNRKYRADVIPETVGQFTGLTDKNGKKIFEGDIVKNSWCYVSGYGVVDFGAYKTLDMTQDFSQGHVGFYINHIDEFDKKVVRKDLMYFANKCEIIGNIHDNPELLKGGADNVE